MLAKKTRAKPKTKGATSGGGGFGAPASTKAAEPTAAEKLKALEKLYLKLTEEQNELKAESAAEVASDSDDGDGVPADDATESLATETILTYVCTVRTTADGGDASDSFADWVPVALLKLKCSTDAEATALVPSAMGAHCKEILESGCQLVPMLRKAPPSSVEYAFEPNEAWMTHVYEGMQGRAERRKEAAATLNVEAGASAADVKKAHRRLMMELHPDRFVGDDEAAAAANERMLAAQEAYLELGGGSGGGGGSRYAAIGGKGRVDFSGALSREALGPLGKERNAQQMDVSLGGWRAGVYPMEEEIAREFAARNLMS